MRYPIDPTITPPMSAIIASLLTTYALIKPPKNVTKNHIGASLFAIFEPLPHKYTYEKEN